MEFLNAKVGDVVLIDSGNLETPVKILLSFVTPEIFMQTLFQVSYIDTGFIGYVNAGEVKQILNLKFRIGFYGG